MAGHNWDKSDRKTKAPLPSNWSSLRLRVLSRDKRECQIRGPKCIGKATEVDHIRQGTDHSLTNLQAVCQPCHRIKTSAQGNEVKKRMRGQRNRPAERHPGSRDSS